MDSDQHNADVREPNAVMDSDSTAHDAGEPPKAPAPVIKTHELAEALVRLRGETQGAVSKATEIKTTNLSVWLRQGKEQVISNERIGKLMYHLGVINSRLRDDMLHQWNIGEKVKDNDLALVFSSALEPNETRWMFEDRRSQPPMTRILMAGKVLIAVSFHPAMSTTPDIAQAFKPERVVMVGEPLKKLVKQDLDALRIRLVELSKDSLLIDPLSVPANALHQFAIQARQDWEPLGQALRLAFSKGATPSDVARVVEEYFSGNAKE